jgi:hypothetical protein
MKDKIQTQRAEFDAVADLAEQYRRVTMTAVVDDDYPEVRHYYEGALAAVLRAMKDNERFGQANRYGLTAAAPQQPSEHVANAEFCPHCNPCRNIERIAKAERLNVDYDVVLRHFCSSLGAGGYNSAGLIEPRVAEQKIEWGIDHLIKSFGRAQQPSEPSAEEAIPTWAYRQAFCELYKYQASDFYTLHEHAQKLAAQRSGEGEK